MGQDFLDLGAWLLEAEEDGECHNQVEGGQQTFLHCRDTICNMVLILEGDSDRCAPVEQSRSFDLFEAFV